MGGLRTHVGYGTTVNEDAHAISSEVRPAPDVMRNTRSNSPGFANVQDTTTVPFVASVPLPTRVDTSLATRYKAHDEFILTSCPTAVSVKVVV